MRARAKREPRWFVWWWPHGLELDEHDPPVPREAQHMEFRMALDQVKELVEAGGCDWIKAFHDTESDLRLRWTRERGYEHMSTYARDYIARRIVS